ncbi:MAG: hypothetical protein V7K40_03255 [Nostoc sp.]
MQEAEAAAELAREKMNRYQQMENTGAIAILQIKDKDLSSTTYVITA